VLYTDGLVERRGEPIDAGMERLRELARGAREGGSSFADRIYLSLLDAAVLDSATLEDDVALLAIESLPLGEELEMTLDASPRALAGLRRTLGRWLLGVGVDGEDAFAITLAASEAAANAIEHAYGANEATVAVSASRDPAYGAIHTTITDTGRWRDSRPYGRGRGLAIMRALVDDVEIDRRDEGTVLRLTKVPTRGRR
jgi:anti-sigma regulatory factor (Ser/Thr protein kinase)